MPVGYSAKCIVCRSPRRVEIDRRLLAGGRDGSNRSVSRWLAGEGESISKDTLRRHRDEHLSLAEDIAERLEQQSQALAATHEGAVARGVGHFEALEENLAKARELRNLVVEAATQQLTVRGECSKSVAGLAAAMMAEVRQTAAALIRGLGEEATSGDERADDTLAHILANLELVQAAHDLLGEVDLYGDSSRDGDPPQQG